MRWALVKVCLAVTVMVVVAFAIPLALVVKETARDRAFSHAERQAAALGPALAITTDRQELTRAVASTDSGADGRIAVHVPAPAQQDDAATAQGDDAGGDSSNSRSGGGSSGNGSSGNNPSANAVSGNGPSGNGASSGGGTDSALGNGTNSTSGKSASQQSAAAAAAGEVQVGHPRAEDGEVRAAQKLGRADTVSVAGGYVLLQPTAVAGGKVAVVEVFVPDEDVNSGVATSWAVLAGVGIALVVGSVAVADRLGTRMVSPAEQLAEAAHGLGEGKLGVRVPVEGPRELRSAAAAFNSMADQVVQLLESERELAADLSHRLRTPLTVLRLNVASLGEGDTAEQTREAVATLENEVDRIIRTAREQRAQSPGNSVQGGADLAAVVRERMGFWSVLAEDEGREARLAGADEPIRVPVARGELSAALDAMLGNVFRHTPEGTAFSVDVHHAGPTSDAVILLVSDAGPGIPDPDDALRRGVGDGGPGSTGLGLDIVRRVAESTGGDVRIGRSVLGGAEIRVWLRLHGVEEPAKPGRARRPKRVRHRR